VARFRPSVERKAVLVDEKVLQDYVGEYELRPESTITVTRSAEKLFIRATGQPMFEFLAESPTEFFRKMGDVQVSFVKNASGVVTHLVLHQDGFDREAKKTK
jgi:hypothetical protein